jgi:putative tributyrin esterase
VNQPELDDQLTRIQLSDPAFECHGLRNMTFYSQALQGRADVSLFVPQALEARANVPIVILLHGVYGSHWSWFLQGGAHVAASSLMEQQKIRPRLLVAPYDGLRGDGTGYLRWGGQNGGQNYESWICDDLIACLESQFCGAGQSAEIFIAGLSMGGYGALRLGAKYPRRFRGISAHSAITAPEQFRDFVRDITSLRTDPPEDLDVLHWLSLHRNELPPLRFDCGEDDSLFAANQTLHRKMVRHPASVHRISRRTQLAILAGACRRYAAFLRGHSANEIAGVMRPDIRQACNGIHNGQVINCRSTGRSNGNSRLSVELLHGPAAAAAKCKARCNARTECCLAIEDNR